MLNKLKKEFDWNISDPVAGFDTEYKEQTCLTAGRNLVRKEDVGVRPIPNVQSA